MTLKPANPLATVQIAVAGSALMVLSYALSFLPFPTAPDSACISQALWIARYELLGVLVPFALGTYISWRYASLLAKGVRNAFWTDPQLDQARNWIESRPMNVIQAVLILAFLIMAVVSLSHHHRHHDNIGFTYTFIFALNPITSIRTALRKLSAPGPRIDWRQSAPIHSNHWGQPPASA